MKKSLVFLSLCLSFSCIVQAMKRERDVPQEEPLATKKAKKETLEQRLLAAIKQGDKEAVKVLLNNKAHSQFTCHDSKGTTGITPVMLAAGNGHKEIVAMLIAAGAFINVQDSDGKTALILAASRGHKDVVKLLLENKANPHFTYKTKGGANITALMTTAFKGYKDIVEMLINADVDVNAQDSWSYTALMYAATRGHKEIVEVLIDAGADVNVQDSNGWTALNAAASKGYKEIVELLLKNKAHSHLTCKAKDITNITPLIVASQSGYKEIVKMLIDACADTTIQTSEGTTALGEATRNGHTEIVEMLLNAGAPIGIRNSTNDTALHVSAQNGYKEIVATLLAHGADVNAQGGDNVTPLMDSVDKGHKEIVIQLLAHGADVNAKDKDGYTALIYAARGGHKDIVELLIKARVDVNEKDNDGTTALMFAVEYGNEVIVKLLIEAGADVHAKDNVECTALMRLARYASMKKLIGIDEDVATKKVYKEILDMLLAKGADINAQDNKNEYTTLSTAACTGCRGLVEALLACGADVNVQDAIGSTALTVAVLEQYKDIVKILLKAGANPNLAYGLEDVTNLTPLWVAVLHNSKEMVEGLLDANADIHARTSKGITALMLAAAADYREMVSLLFRRGASFAVGDKVLMAREFNGNLTDSLRLLNLYLSPVIQQYMQDRVFYAQSHREHYLEQGRYLGESHSPLFIWNQTPLMWACMFGHKEVIEELFKAKLPLWYLNAQDVYGRTALMYAIIFGNEDIAKLLIQAYEKRAEQLYKALQREANPVKHVQLQQELEKAKRAINICDKQGKSALAYGVEKSKLLVSRLLQAGARPGLPLMNTLLQKEHSDMLVLLIQKGFIQPKLEHVKQP